MKRIFLATLSLGMTVGLWAAEPKASIRKTVENALEASVQQYRKLYTSIEGKEGRLPRTAEGDKLVTCNAHYWTSGFFPGSLWYLYEYTRDAQDLEAASRITDRLVKEQYTTDNHDVGFIINCSYGNGYRLTGNEAYRQIIINAGNSLATRFSETTGCIKSWNRWNYPVIIDNMMNLELLTVASSMSSDLTGYNIAKRHADTTLKNHFRKDGSSYHVVDYNPETGEVMEKKTYQGHADESSWSRGQAWGLYGYTMMYRQTGDRKYLDHAVKIGRFITEHPRLPKDGIPYWDFDAPEIPKADRDASAGAIMASAFVELSTYVDGELGDKFLRLAEKQIKSLSSSAYMAKTGQNGGFIIMHCTGFKAKGSEVDAPLSYADYYFIEALMRYRRLLDGQPVVDVRTALSENPDRALWLSVMQHIADPLLTNLSKGELRKNMPVRSRNRNMASRHNVTHLEAFGRLMTGIAPWLELGPDSTTEGQLRKRYIDLTIKSIQHCVDPESPDHMNFSDDRQPLVDAAFLAHGLLRSRTQIWNRLDTLTKERMINELKSSRVIKPSENNWLFFSAMVECALKEFSGEWEYERIQYALDRHKEWYKGDGWYGDGKEFHFDYYNSFVIQPMMMQVLDIAVKYRPQLEEFRHLQKERYSRFAEQQERLISPEGTFPAIGRSIAYRFGAFYALSDVSYRHILPKAISPAQVRSGLTAVIKRQISAPGTFDDKGWLNVGFCGDQPSVGETYISTGSLYLCSAVMIALGLEPSDPFWSSVPEPWTGMKIWGGMDIPCDKALKK